LAARFFLEPGFVLSADARPSSARAHDALFRRGGLRGLALNHCDPKLRVRASAAAPFAGEPISGLMRSSKIAFELFDENSELVSRERFDA
jgi:hypothetical protein